jgi:YHS domain-containing protein
MTVDRERAVVREIDGRPVYFCSDHCADAFDGARALDHSAA